jgi:flavodoxin
MALPLLAKAGGALGHYKGRENFKEGKHVAGEGDGQSDDIPAWLADGEFVFPADVVSALGNGSTKAGTDKLYEMMHGIRDRARSKGPKDLPPPALKSPLDYLKSSKRSTT